MRSAPSDYVTKPIDRERLRALLGRFCEPGAARRALIVEDDADTRRWLHRALEREGWQVSEAAERQGGAGVPAPRRRSNVILLDLMMPEMDGFEFLAERRKDAALCRIPVIVVTAADLTEDDRRRLNGGVLHVLAEVGTRRGISCSASCASWSRGACRTRSSSRAPTMPKILYVEDNEDNVYMLTRRLERAGFEVVVAADGEQGVAVARAERPDLILMDLSLPVRGRLGGDAASQGAAETRAIPIIALSAHAMPGDREKALEAGCDDYDTKPVSCRACSPRSGRCCPRGRER